MIYESQFIATNNLNIKLIPSISDSALIVPDFPPQIMNSHIALLTSHPIKPLNDVIPKHFLIFGPYFMGYHVY